MFVLLNTMLGGNEENQVISKHKTAKAAGKAAAKLLRKVKRGNGEGAYLPLSLRVFNQSGPFGRIDEEDALEYQEGQCL